MAVFEREVAPRSFECEFRFLLDALLFLGERRSPSLREGDDFGNHDENRLLWNAAHMTKHKRLKPLVY